MKKLIALLTLSMMASVAYAADSKISALSDAGAIQSGDVFIIARSGANYKKDLYADITNWDTAYGWGDHALAGYAVTSDPTTFSSTLKSEGTLTALDLNILSMTATTENSFTLYGKYQTDTAISNIMPSNSATDSRMAVDIWPKGSPADFGDYGVAWLDICDTDPDDAGTGNECVGAGKLKDGIGQISTSASGTGTVRDLNLQVNGGNVGVGIGTTAPSYQLDVGGSGRFSGGLIGQTATTAVSEGHIGEFIGAVCNPASPSGTTVTISIADPAVVTWTNHRMDKSEGDVACPITFSTTGALPTGITAGTKYWAVAASSSTLNIATTPQNAVDGVFIETTGTQSGTQSVTGGVELVDATWNSGSAMVLSPGIWDIQGQCSFWPDTTTATSSMLVGSGSTIASPSFPDLSYGFFRQTFPNGAISSVPIPLKRFYVATETVYYGLMMSQFTTSGTSGACQTSAIRAN